MVHLVFSEKIFTPRLYLEPLKYEDAEEIFYTYASKPEATKFVSWPTHKTVSDTNAFLLYARTARQQHKDYSFGIRTLKENRLIGSIGVMNFDGEIQFGYILSPTQWNKGYATEACKVILQFLKNQSGIKRIFTFVAPANVSSIRVLNKCGLIEEALLAKHMIFPNVSREPADCLLFVLPSSE
jgi:[ribosomal protein S5]-alanine N-acetyltransferase